MSGPLGRFRGLFRRNNSPNLSSALSTAITNFDKAANSMAKASGNQNKTSRNLPAANMNSILGMKNASGNTYALKLARSIMPLYRAAIGAVVKASVGATTQTAAAAKISNIANFITYKMTAANYLKLVNSKKRNITQNRANFGPNKSPNAAAWWAAVNSALASRPILGGAGAGFPQPPSGLPANVAQSNRGVFKKGNKPNNQGRNLWYPAVKNNKGNWVIMNSNAPHVKNNAGNFTPVGSAAV